MLKNLKNRSRKEPKQGLQTVPPNNTHKISHWGPYASKGYKIIPKRYPKDTPNEIKNHPQINLLRNIGERVAKGCLWGASGYPLGAKNYTFPRKVVFLGKIKKVLYLQPT